MLLFMYNNIIIMSVYGVILYDSMPISTYCVPQSKIVSNCTYCNLVINATVLLCYKC